MEFVPVIGNAELAAIFLVGVTLRHNHPQSHFIVIDNFIAKSPADKNLYSQITQNIMLIDGNKIGKVFFYSTQ
jgi:hypothetical protein